MSEQTFKDFYIGMTPDNRVKYYKEYSELMLADTEIRENDEALINWANIETSLQVAIIQHNNIKSENMHLKKIADSLTGKNQTLLTRDSFVADEIQTLKDKHTLEIETLKESFRIEKNDLRIKQTTALSRVSISTSKVKPSLETNNAVMLLYDDYCTLKDEVSKVDLINNYKEFENVKDNITLKIFSKIILKLIASKTNITDKRLDDIKEEVERVKLNELEVSE